MQWIVSSVCVCMWGGCLWPDEWAVSPGTCSPWGQVSSASISNSSGPVVRTQKLHCHEGKGEKEAPQADDIACRSSYVSARVPGVCLWFTLAVPGLSPGADGHGASVKKRPCELEATAALLAECWSRENAGCSLCPWNQERGSEPCLPWEGRVAASKLPCWGWASAPASLVACGPLICALLWDGFESRI